MEKLTPEEIKRYSRHLTLQEIGPEKQLKLKRASVLIVGAGGLGVPALQYLTAAGVGTLGIADHDQVDLSNLQRQVLYTVDDIGKPKAETAAARLKKLNPNVNLVVHPDRIEARNAMAILEKYDIILDGTDNFATRYLLNDACILLDKPLVHGSILKFEGQLSVFNYKRPEGTFTANYRDLFPTPPDADSVPNCEEAGVLGVLPGIIGTMQANEALKIILGYGTPLAGILLLFDAATMQQTLIKIPDRQTRRTITTLIDYDEFCGKSQEKSKSLEPDFNPTRMKEITVQELKELQESGADFQLIDVREPHEYDICNLDGELIPMSEVPGNVDKIDKNKKVVVHCRSGKRSGDAILWLERNHQFNNLYNLKGGILAWAKEIDPEMPTY